MSESALNNFNRTNVPFVQGAGGTQLKDSDGNFRMVTRTSATASQKIYKNFTMCNADLQEKLVEA